VFLPVVSACFTTQSRARAIAYYLHMANVAHALPLCAIPADFSQQQVDLTHIMPKKISYSCFFCLHDGN
jgi:hypothetical protein